MTWGKKGFMFREPMPCDRYIHSRVIDAEFDGAFLPRVEEGGWSDISLERCSERRVTRIRLIFSSYRTNVFTST